MHGAQLSTDCPTNAPGQHYRSQDRADLLDHGDIDDRTKTIGYAKGIELLKGFNRKHHPDEQPQEHDHRNTACTNGKELWRQQIPSPPTAHATEQPFHGC